MPLHRSIAPSRRSIALRTVAVVVAALAFVLLTGWIDGAPGVAPVKLFQQPLYLLANAWPGLLALGLLLVLTRRLLLSFLLVAMAQAVVYGVNRLKVAELGVPLVPADFRMIGQLRHGGLHLLVGYLPHGPWPYLAVLAAVLAIAVLWRYEPPLFAPRTHGKRVTGAVLLGLGLVSLFGGMQAWAKVYNGKRLWMEPWSAASTADHSGLISSLLMFHLQDSRHQRKADPAAARALIAQFAPQLRQLQAKSPDGALPDIVVIQSESFFDPAKLKGYQDADQAPNFHRLAATGVSGPLHVPTFGGGTIRTEFEVLSGLSLRYLPELQFPYLQLNPKVMPSMVHTLRSHGYATTALHGNNPTFWNRDVAFKAMGFERFVSQAQFPPARNDGTYMADTGMTDAILAQLKDSGPPQFLFAISIEAHGPYDTVPADPAARDAKPVPPGVVGKDALEMRNYLYHIGHADQELGRLANAMAKRARPSLLLFYGDHLPALVDTFRRQGFVDGQDLLSESGSWLLLSPGHPQPAQTQSLAAWMLPGKLLATAGIHDDAYFTLSQVLAPQLAGLTQAPDAPRRNGDADVQPIDQRMADVTLLQLNGGLDRIFPAVDPALATRARYRTDTDRASASASRPTHGASPR